MIEMKVFWFMINSYSNPCAVLVVAKSREQAEIMMEEVVSRYGSIGTRNGPGEYFGPDHSDILEDLDLSTSRVVILSPPGNRDFGR